MPTERVIELEAHIQSARDLASEQPERGNGALIGRKSNEQYTTQSHGCGPCEGDFSLYRGPLVLGVTGRAPEGFGVAGERGRPDGGRELLERRRGSFGVSLWALG